MPWAFSHQQQMSLLMGKKCNLSSPPHFPFPGKPKAIKLNQALLFFTSKMLLSLNYGFKWLLNRVPRELQMLPDGRGSRTGGLLQR